MRRSVSSPCSSEDPAVLARGCPLYCSPPSGRCRQRPCCCCPISCSWQRRREIKLCCCETAAWGRLARAADVRAAARRRVIDVFSHSDAHTQQSQRLLAPTAACCYDASLGVARRPLRRDGSVSQKIMTKSIKALGGKGAPETILRRAQRAAASLNEAQTRADSLLTIPSLRLSRQPRAVPPGARESRKRGSLWILTPPRPAAPTHRLRIHNQRWPPQQRPRRSPSHTR